MYRVKVVRRAAHVRPTQYDLRCSSTVLQAPMTPSHLAAGSVLKWSCTSLELIYVMYCIGWQNAAAWQIMSERSDVCSIAQSAASPHIGYLPTLFFSTMNKSLAPGEIAFSLK